MGTDTYVVRFAMACVSDSANNGDDCLRCFLALGRSFRLRIDEIKRSDVRDEGGGCHDLFREVAYSG